MAQQKRVKINYVRGKKVNVNNKKGSNNEPKKKNACRTFNVTARLSLLKISPNRVTTICASGIALYINSYIYLYDFSLRWKQYYHNVSIRTLRHEIRTLYIGIPILFSKIVQLKMIMMMNLIWLKWFGSLCLCLMRFFFVVVRFRFRCYVYRKMFTCHILPDELHIHKDLLGWLTMPSSIFFSVLLYIIT